MKKIFVSIAIISIFFFSCTSSTDSANTTPEVTTGTPSMVEAPVMTEAPAMVQSADSSMTITSPVSAAAAPVQAPANSATGLNPAHGEPGHRCDIAVGAPLNSAPAAPAPAVTAGTVPTTPESKTVAPAPTAPTPAPVATAPGTNPPHGQPGHDCKIAVGAPLPK